MFSGGIPEVIESSSEADNDDTNHNEGEEKLEEVDFKDIAKLFEPTKQKSKQISSQKSSVGVVEEQFTGGFANNNSIPPAASLPQRSLADVGTLTKMMDENLLATEKSLEDDIASKSTPVVEPGLFYIDTQPSPIPADMALPSNPFPSNDFEDDIIVYVAPHPRKGIQTSPGKELPTSDIPNTSQFAPHIRDASLSVAVASSSTSPTAIDQQPIVQPQIPALSSFSFSFSTPEGKTRGRLRIPAVTTPRLAKSWKRKRGLLSKKGGKKPVNSFRTFGAMREEAQLHDPKMKERRRGDSDLDWGDGDGDDDDDDDDGAEQDGFESPSGFVNGNAIKNANGKNKGKGKAREVEDGHHGMEVDTELDTNAMQRFVGGLLGEDAGRHVTMDDLMDDEQIELENEQDTGDESASGIEGSGEDEDTELERVLADEESMLISEALEFADEEEYDDDDDDDDESEDEDQTPRTSFQKRLERLRNQASSSKHDDEYDVSDDYDDMLEKHIDLELNDYVDYDKGMVSFFFLLFFGLVLPVF